MGWALAASWMARRAGVIQRCMHWLDRVAGAMFIGFGSMTNVLAPVAEKLDGTLIDMRFVKPIDEEAVLEAARTHDMIVCAEEGMLMGGACNAVLEVLADNGVVRPVMRFGLPDEFIEQGTQAELLEDVGLTSEAIESKVAERIAKLGI